MPIIGRPEVANKFGDVCMQGQRKCPHRQAAVLIPMLRHENIKDAVSRLGVGEKQTEIFKDAKSHNKMGKDEFLKLLSFQMQNQDPMNPMDQNKFAGELAQFSQLEQLANMRTAIEASHKNDIIEEKYLAASFLGKRVLTEGGALDLKADGQPVELNFALDEKAKNVILRITDQKGGMISEIRTEDLYRGNHQLNWDGIQFDGQRAAAGKYNFQVLAFDELSRPVKAMTKASGVVTSVGFENGDAILTVDGRKVLLKNVDKIELDRPNMNSVPNLGEASSAVGAKPGSVVAGKPMLDMASLGKDIANIPVQAQKANPVQAAKAYQSQNENLVDYSR